uniref:C-type lectin domain-containing protein n=1 Tax=Myripristis murdjan TaxID=586833 RepID=A0A668A7N4_9TELE
MQVLIHASTQTHTNVHTKNFHARDYTTNCKDTLVCFIGEHVRAAAVCLGLLCLLLLATVISLVVHYNKSDCNLSRERDEFQTKFNNLTEEKHQLQMEIERLTLKIIGMRTPCSDGWIHFSSSCYFISSESKSWNASRQDCLRRGADLVIINSREENVRGLEIRLWIGLSDLETEGKWKWLDGSSLSYTYWGPGEPNSDGGKNEDCGEIRFHDRRNRWNDESCGSSNFWICEKPADP